MSSSYGSIRESIAAPQPQQRPELEVNADRLDESSKDIFELADILHSLADRIFGSQPTPIGKDNVIKGAPSSSMGRLQMGHDSLAAGRLRLRQAVDRLSVL